MRAGGKLKFVAMIEQPDGSKKYSCIWGYRRRSRRLRERGGRICLRQREESGRFLPVPRRAFDLRSQGARNTPLTQGVVVRLLCLRRLMYASQAGVRVHEANLTVCVRVDTVGLMQKSGLKFLYPVSFSGG